jgi:T-complex protein 1 subunit delta
VRVVAKVGGTIDDSELVDGCVFDVKAAKAAGGPTRIEKAKVGLIQFQLSPPKADIESSVVISDYQQMDRVYKEERNYILALVKKVRFNCCWTGWLLFAATLHSSHTHYQTHHHNQTKPNQTTNQNHSPNQTNNNHRAQIRASGCNVLLVQKSILRDAVTDLALHYLAKAKIMVVRDVEREDVEFISKTLVNRGGGIQGFWWIEAGWGWGGGWY